jgi:hypothetical protein
VSGVFTLEDKIRQEMTIRGSRRIHIIKRDDGLYEAAYMHADGRTGTCDVHADPADALWNILSPYAARRTLPSGRMVEVNGHVFGVDRPASKVEPEDIDLLADIDLLDDEELDLLA